MHWGLLLDLAIPHPYIYPNKITFKRYSVIYMAQDWSVGLHNKGDITRGHANQDQVFWTPKGLCQAGSKKTRRRTGVGEGEGGGSSRKKEGPSCWGPGWSGNDRQQAWHRARPQASSPSEQGKLPSPPPHHAPCADATCEWNEKLLWLTKLREQGSCHRDTSLQI